jgi:thiol-disulfide isomerase/thioredoxin
MNIFFIFMNLNRLLCNGFISTYVHFFISIASAQQGNRKPLILQGKLSNSPERFLKIFFYDEKDKLLIDTLHLNDEGEFYLKTFKITRPQRTSIQQNTTQINGIYVAPGYNLQITGDATNFNTLKATKKITGIGEESNRYRIQIDDAYAAKINKTAWYELKLEELLLHIKKVSDLEDAVLHHVFDSPQPKDPYFNYFKKMIEIDNQSMAFYMMLQFAVMNDYSRNKMKDLVDNNIPALFAKGMSNDNYLIAEDYTSWTLPLYYEYRKKLNQLEDSIAVQRPGYSLQLINQLFTGKVKQYFLQYTVNRAISRTSSIEELNNAKKVTQPFYTAITDAAVKKDLAASYAERELQLMQLQIGKSAPPFSLPDERGKIHHLSNFKGKVIYIDLWASWCEPSRAEVPNFKKLKDKFRDNDKVAFMGIAVSDGEKEWRKALSEEKPDWLQLYDASSAVARSYVATAIPKYILIDKSGKVVNFNAPSPGDKSIEDLIKDEIAKP